MCNHKSIFDKEHLIKVIPDFKKPETNAWKALFDKPVLTIDSDKRIVNVKAGMNFLFITVRVMPADHSKKIKIEDKYVNVEVKLAMNKVYHLKEKDINYMNEPDGEEVDGDDENNICYHEQGHEQLSEKIIPKDEGFTYRKYFGPDIENYEQLASWVTKVIDKLNERFLDIYDEAENLYHAEYGDNGSPWTRNLCKKECMPWKKFILKTLKENYSDELADLFIE